MCQMTKSALLRYGEGWHGYDREKYRAMLLEAFEPFVQFIPRPPSRVPLRTSHPKDDLNRFPPLRSFDNIRLLKRKHYLPSLASTPR